MKSDIIAKHLLADNGCGNCKFYTRHQVVATSNNATDESNYVSSDGTNYNIYNVKQCDKNRKPKLGVCKDWEEKEQEEGICYSTYTPIYTTEIFNNDE